MVNVNEWISTGVFNMRRVSRENTPMETATMGYFWNFDGASSACVAMRTMLQDGPTELVRGSCNCVSMPTHKKSTLTCGDCAARFTLPATLARSRLATCGECAVYFCTDCYDRKVQVLSHVSGGTPVSNKFVIDNRKLWHCRVCVSRIK
jgi:hypothetical protein